MLKLHGVTKYYSNTAALQNVDLELDRGEVVGLFGANGAGKTTLLKCTMGLLDPNDGWPILDGDELHPNAYEKLSFITEEGSYFPDISPLAHGEFYSKILPRFNTGRYMQLLDFFQLEHKKKARALSRGQRAKLEIAIGMSRGADFILMDEPFLGKDIFTRRDFLKLMIAMLQPHEGIIIATHQIEEIEMFITRAIVMHEGKIVANQQIDALEEGLSNFIQKICGYDGSRVLEFTDCST